MQADYLYEDPNEDPSVSPDPEPVIETAVIPNKSTSYVADKKK